MYNDKLATVATKKYIKAYLFAVAFGTLIQLIGILANKALYPTFSSSRFSIYYLFFPLLIPFVLAISPKAYNKTMILFLLLFMVTNISGLFGFKDGSDLYYNENVFDILNVVANLVFCGNEIVVRQVPTSLETLLPNNIYNFTTLFIVNIILFFVFKAYKLVFNKIINKLH